ncbi:MAG: response regulator [Rhodoferax sp.]
MNVLVVDDDPTAREVLAQVLAPLCTHGHVHQASSAETALTALEQGFLADLLVCDVRMPDTSGIELLDRLRQDTRYCDLPVMMITASPDQDVVRQAMQLRVQGFILKPATNDAVLRARTALGRFHTQLAEDPHQVCKRLSCTPRQYEGALDALLEKLTRLNELLVHWCAGDTVEGTCADLPATAALVTALAPCANGARALGLTALLKHLQSLERLALRDTTQHDARYDELRQILALQHQWLRSYRAGRQAQPPLAERLTPQPHASASRPPLIRIPPVAR